MSDRAPRADVPLSTPQAPQKTADRDARGRFVKGNRGGPGNPFNRRTAAARQAFCAAVSDEDLAAIARALTAKARAGDVAAAKVLLAYLIGKPGPAVEPDTLDLEEF